jgi:hypothetical protein
MTSPDSNVAIETNGFSFSTEHLREIGDTAQELAKLVNDSGVSNGPVSKEEAEEFASGEPLRVFSLVLDRMSSGGFWLRPGFDPNCGDYLPSRIPYSGKGPHPCTEICAWFDGCRGEDPEGVESCANCINGTFIFDLSWNADRVVTARAATG